MRLVGAHCDIAKHLCPAVSRRVECTSGPQRSAYWSAEIVPTISRARFSAISVTSRTDLTHPRQTSHSNRSSYGRLPRRFDADAMHQAAKRLVGKYDFTPFRDTEVQAKSPMRDALISRCLAHGDDVDILQSARSFLHSSAFDGGSLYAVGEGAGARRSASDLRPAPRRLRPVATHDGLIWCGGIAVKSYSRRRGRRASSR